MKKKVLIVDDHGHIRFMLSNRLSKFGYETYSLDNARNIVDDTIKVKPDIIIMDFMLPGVDGIEAVKLLKKNPETNNIPIVMLTAVSTKKTVVEAIKAGAVDYIVKPFKSEDIHKKLANILNKEQEK